MERNCIRGNGVNGNQGWRVGIIGDFGVLRDTVIRNNTIADSGEAISIAGSFAYSNISVTKNAVRRGTIVMAGTTVSEITRNDIDITGATPPRHGIFLGGDNTGLVISSNDIVAAAGAGIYFCSVCTDDPHPNPNVGLLITANTIRDDLGGGISMAAQEGLQVTRSVMYRNTIQHNGGSGIVLNQGSVGNLLLDNTSTGNARGIFLNGATGMVVLRNTIIGNTLDAWDTTPEQNQWIANRCVTDDPAGALCGRPPSAAEALSATDGSRSSTTAASLPARPNADLSHWPCIRVPVWDVAADGVPGTGRLLMLPMQNLEPSAATDLKNRPGAE